MAFSVPPQTFLNPWYEASLVPIFIITLCTGLWAFVTAGGSFHNVLKCLSCKAGPGGGGRCDAGGSAAMWGLFWGDVCPILGVGRGWKWVFGAPGRGEEGSRL